MIYIEQHYDIYRNITNCYILKYNNNYYISRKYFNNNYYKLKKINNT
jgi:hypothetical protein